MKKHTHLVKPLLLLTLAFGTSAYAADPSDEDLGLHSDGGQWNFIAAKDRAAAPHRVLLIGDSIMNGYRGKVIAGLKGKSAVDCWLTPLHLASPELHHDLERVVAQGPYDVIHFNIGLHGWTPGRIPEGQYEPLLRAYVKILKDGAPGARLIWASTTPMTVKGKPTELDPVHNKTITDRNAIAERVMKDEGIAVNDLYELLSDKLHLGRGDRFHWKGPAYGQMARQVVDAIRAALTARAGD
jgi:lysophospholipase L1-like esterase